MENENKKPPRGPENAGGSTDPRVNAARAAVDAAETFLEILEAFNERQAVRVVVSLVTDLCGGLVPDAVAELACRFAVEPPAPTPGVWPRLRDAINAGDLERARAVLAELEAAMARDLAPRSGH
jgi:hypothetical protein